MAGDDLSGDAGKGWRFLTFRQLTLKPTGLESILKAGKRKELQNGKENTGFKAGYRFKKLLG